MWRHCAAVRLVSLASRLAAPVTVGSACSTFSTAVSTSEKLGGVPSAGTARVAAFGLGAGPGGGSATYSLTAPANWVAGTAAGNGGITFGLGSAAELRATL